MHTYPLTEVVAVTTAQELADWLGVDVTDPLLPVMNITATAAVIEFLYSELIDRERVVVYQDWPVVGTPTGRSLSRQDAQLSATVELPYARLQTVTSAEVAGDLSTDYTVLDTLPSKLEFDSISISTASDVPALKVQYTAGVGTIAEVPQTIKTAVLMAADFLYNNRGSCSASDALDKSGAATLLAPYMAKVVII
ncbi:MAG: phage gp6-like head-tail connector protein [Planctomycetes bacterium]|nr:phage gp6-like head-tail connector protein [Planctomycetota bacterium]